MAKLDRVYWRNQWLMGISIPAGLLCVALDYHTLEVGCALWVVVGTNWVAFWFYRRSWKRLTDAVRARLTQKYHDAAV